MYSLIVIYVVQCRNMEDFITWTDTSSIRKQVLEYNELVRFVFIII